MAMTEPEILSPAGDFERLEMAVAFGANAVYLAGRQFGMRGGVPNFTNEELKRAYSTYIQVGYDFILPLGTVIGAKVGLTPWRGAYSGYEEVWKNAGTVALTNLNIRVEHEFEVGAFTFSVFGEGMLNCYGINKDNAITKITDRAEQRINGCIGGSIYFGGDW